jgi:hypothetical protein
VPAIAAPPAEPLIPEPLEPIAPPFVMVPPFVSVPVQKIR